MRSYVPDGSLIAFPEPEFGYFITYRGTVRRSTDGGRAWRTVGMARPAVAVDFVSRSRGFLLTKRGGLWMTRNAGRTWKQISRFHPRPGDMTGPGAPLALDFVDGQFGFVAAGPRTVFRTRDGGSTWEPLSFACPRGDYLAGLAFANRREGFAACGGQPATAQQFRAYHFTHDGGTHWHYGRSRVQTGHVALVALPSPHARYIYASRLGIARLGGQTLLFTDDTDSVLAMSWPTARRGYALLLHGGLMRTLDGGRHWRRPS